MILALSSRPFCLSPTLTQGTPSEGVSTTPEDELPATTAQYFMAERYRSTPMLVKATYCPGRAAHTASIRALMSAPPASALALVKTAASPQRSSAAHNASNCAAGDAPPAVSGW